MKNHSFVFDTSRPLREMPYFLPVSRFGRTFFDFDNLYGTGLDMFDPFDDHDLSLFPSVLPTLYWLNEPPAVLDARGRRRPRPEKFRITLNVQGFDKDDLKTEIKDNKLVVHAKRHQQSERTGDFDTREFQKSFDLPKNVVNEQLTSFVTAGGVLVVEIPLKVEEREASGDASAISHRAPSIFDFDEFFKSNFSPQVIEVHPGKKKIEMNVDVSAFKPDNVHISLKDNELIVKAEQMQKNQSEKEVSRTFYYKQVTLPPGTDTKNLKTQFDNGKVYIEAPFNEEPVMMIKDKNGE
ncbi:hypothetical protein ACOME3_004381 [Neoechinorhynchus agilis]